jgi:hypothetical protein
VSVIILLLVSVIILLVVSVVIVVESVVVLSESVLLLQAAITAIAIITNSFFIVFILKINNSLYKLAQIVPKKHVPVISF